MSLNKKAFLLTEETLKIIIAVIAISFLIYLLSSLYFANRSSKDLEVAKFSLNHLIEEINSLEEGETRDVEIFNPRNWHLMSWPHEITTGFLFFTDERIETPRSCSNLGWENCLCICRKDNPDNCDEKGFCMENDFVVEDAGKNIIKIVNPPLILTIDYENKIIEREI